MTDITKEKELYDRHGYETVMVSLMEQEKEIKNKKHLISVLHLINSLKELIDLELFPEIKVQLLWPNSRLFFEFRDNSNKHIFYENYTEDLMKVANLFRTLCARVDTDPDLYSRTLLGRGGSQIISLTHPGLLELQKELLSPALQISLEKMNLNNQVAQPQLVNKQEPKMKI